MKYPCASAHMNQRYPDDEFQLVPGSANSATKTLVMKRVSDGQMVKIFIDNSMNIVPDDKFDDEIFEPAINGFISTQIYTEAVERAKLLKAFRHVSKPEEEEAKTIETRRRACGGCGMPTTQSYIVGKGWECQCCGKIWPS